MFLPNAHRIPYDRCISEAMQPLANLPPSSGLRRGFSAGNLPADPDADGEAGGCPDNGPQE